MEAKPQVCFSPPFLLLLYDAPKIGCKASEKTESLYKNPGGFSTKALCAFLYKLNLYLLLFFKLTSLLSSIYACK